MAEIAIVKRPNARQKVPYDIVLAAVGYEQRARFAVEEVEPFGKERVALVFGHSQIHSFQQNRDFFEDHGFAEVPATEDQLQQYLTAAITEIATPHAPAIKIWIDISSMTRTLIARFSFECSRLASKFGVEIQTDFNYSPAEFYEPPDDVAPIIHKGAVISELSGWSSDPSEPCCAIIGVGYEGVQALGAIEDLEPVHTWLFEPEDHPENFAKCMKERNEVLLDLTPDSSKFDYTVHDPFELYLALESLVFGCLKRYRVLVLPFGPKIFALCAVLVGLEHSPGIAVWRISGGKYADAIDKVPDGSLSSIRCNFGMNGKKPVVRALKTQDRKLPAYQRKLDLD